MNLGNVMGHGRLRMRSRFRSYIERNVQMAAGESNGKWIMKLTTGMASPRLGDKITMAWQGFQCKILSVEN